MRTRDVVVVAFVLVLIGSGLGLVLFSIGQKTPTSSAETPADARPAQPTPGAIGSTGYLRPGGQLPYQLIWVDELGLSAINRAYENRDSKAMDRVLSAFEYLEVPDGTPVKVTARSRTAIQVEVLSGQHNGRRGWIDPYLLAP